MSTILSHTPELFSNGLQRGCRRVTTTFAFPYEGKPFLFLRVRKVYKDGGMVDGGEEFFEDVCRGDGEGGGVDAGVAADGG